MFFFSLSLSIYIYIYIKILSLIRNPQNSRPSFTAMSIQVNEGEAAIPGKSGLDGMMDVTAENLGSEAPFSVVGSGFTCAT